MKKLLIAAAAIAGAAVIATGATACNNSNKIYVDTNAYFAPFEYYTSAQEIAGVDVDIMNLVGEKLGKEVVFENTEFGVIIDNVSSGKKYDCGAAGITITDARKELVDFSNPYYTAVQYVIYKGDTLSVDGTTKDGVEYILWESLADLKIGVQTNTTGDIFVDGEINGQKSDPDYGYDGVLYGTKTESVPFSNAQLAVDGLGNLADCVVIDELPAKFIVTNNTTANLHCYPLYYDEETATEEEYAICVTKGNTELLNAINEVLAQLGKDGINKLVSKHLGLTD